MKKIYFLMAGLLSATVMFAQPSYYVLPLVNVGANPGNLNNDDENPGQPNWTDIHTSTPTDAWSTQQSIPFPFQFNGVTESSFYVSTNGVLTFASATPASLPGVSNFPLPSNIVPNKSVCMWGVEISGGNDAVRSKVFGTAGSRQLWISYVSASAPEMTGQSEWAYWSIVLEEGTNNIYVVEQRTFASAGNVALTVGVQVDNSNFVQLPASPMVAGTTNATAGNGSDPSDNTVYQFINGTQPQYDMSVASETVPQYVSLTAGGVSFSGDIFNFGSADVTSFDMNYTINGGAPVAGSITASIPSLTSATFTHPTAWTPAAAGLYTIELYATNINGNPDGNTSNDRLSFTVNVFDQAATRKSLMEVFTSSTCPPCLPGNQNMDNVVVPTISNYTIVKYQQDFPGAGDPYVTQEAVSRRGYYGVNSIPRMEIDGQWDQNAASLTASIFNDFQNVPAFLDFTKNKAESNANTGVVDLDVDINILEDYAAGNYRAQMAIVEKRTTGNVANNGETEFFYVMMDMVPTENGTPISGLTKGATINLAQSPNLSTSFVEEFYDLRLVVWVEDETTKQIMNSAWFDITMTVGIEEEGLAIAAIYPNPAKDFLTIELNEAADFSVNVMSTTGQVVLSNNYTDAANATLNTASLSAGVYMVNITSGNETTTQRVVISK